MKTRKLRIILILAFAAGVASMFALVAFDAQAPWWFISIQLGLALVVLAPAIAFIRGVKWCRPVVAALSLVFLFLWTLSPMAQHAIDRHAGFWIFWSVIEALTIGAVWASLKKEPIQMPETTRGK
jgi:predicted membrane channel-forming protein YqfA (hemolysin III family)